MYSLYNSVNLLSPQNNSTQPLMSQPLATKVSTPLSENVQILKYSRVQSGRWGGATLGAGRHLGRGDTWGGATLGAGRHLGRGDTWGGATLGVGRHLGRGYTWGGATLGAGLHLGRGYTWGEATLGAG